MITTVTNRQYVDYLKPCSSINPYDSTDTSEGRVFHKRDSLYLVPWDALKDAEPKRRVWCGVCGVYCSPGDAFPCADKYPDSIDHQANCAIIGRDYEFFQEDEGPFITEIDSPVEVHREHASSDGGPSGYYDLPENAKTLNDLIEHKRMPFALGNIFKACYRLGEKSGVEMEYDLNKITYFNERLKGMLERFGSIR